MRADPSVIVPGSADELVADLRARCQREVEVVGKVLAAPAPSPADLFPPVYASHQD
jgi:hypothetical protein